MNNYEDPHYKAEAISGILNAFGPPTHADQQSSYQYGGPSLLWKRPSDGKVYAQLVIPPDTAIILFYDPFITDLLSDRISMMITALLTLHDPGNPACTYEGIGQGEDRALIIEEVTFGSDTMAMLEQAMDKPDD